ncbi:MAG: organic solvent tolerance protein OstA, partial [Pirellulaceae bacterium]
YEQECDLSKDQTTGFELKRYNGNRTWSLTGDARLNEFFTQTEWLPRFDHFLLGQSLLYDRLTWYARSNVGYARLRVGEEPLNPQEIAKWDPLAWETDLGGAVPVDREGLRAVTRQELDLPVALGPVKVVPYIAGELGYWGEDLTGAEVARAFGQAGVRAALPFWRVDPTVQSTLFNLNGLAHKVVFDVDVFWSDADQDLDRFPLYDPLDDDSTEHFRRRLFFDTFGGIKGIGDNVALRFDERYFALRSGMQSQVTAPSAEIAGDLTLARVGVRQRWQTKRGLPGQQHVVDWLVLDVEGAFFPDADRDNFGEPFGLLDYDLRWHVGDRFTVLSDGFADFFDEGLRTVSIGGKITRPERSSLYLGYRSIEGPISSNILSGSIGYRSSEKWIISAGAAVDLGETGSIGQNLTITRIGESVLLRFGFNVDVSRGNVGVTVAIEPRFLPRNRLGLVGGVQIPPAGAYGLE